MGSYVVKESIYPTDLWLAISLHLPVYHLALNRNLLKLYDESWFQRKINLLYENYDKYNETYEYLYRRALRSGTIEIGFSSRKASYKLPIHGIKAVSSFLDYDACLILTFDTNLYSYNERTNGLKFIASDVRDVSEGCYITRNRFCIFRKNTVISLENDEFIATITYFGTGGTVPITYLAVTKNKIYTVRGNDDPVCTPTKFVIKNIICYDYKIMLQSNDNKLYFFYHTLAVGDLYLDKVKNVCADYIQLLDNTIININKLRIKNTENGNLRAAIENSLLIEDKLYSLSQFTAPMLIERNVKNLGQFCQFKDKHYIIR